jgi:alpha-L-rhamnosidase
MLKPGENALGAFLGDGWFAGKVGLFSNQMYGDQTSLLATLLLEMPDGSVRTFVTGKDWQGTQDGPIRASDMLDGETIDARHDMKGWDAPGFDAAAWKPVSVFAKPEARLTAQTNEPIRVTQEVKPVAMTEPAPGVYVVDFGQNLPGRVRLRTTAPAGTEIVTRHGEVLSESGRLYTDNLRSAKQTDRFVCAGGAAEFEPRFTYHGFRYAEITGLPSRPAEGDIVARVFHSDSPSVGSFECSNPMLNRLMSNIRWTQYANMMSVPTDCPQRDERLGWMGDAYIFAQTGIYNLDMAAFLAKWAVDIREAQGAQGQYSDVSPNPVLATNKFTSVPGWGDAGVAVPWKVYLNYGDRRLVAEHYDSAKKWIDYIRANNPDLIWAKARGNDYGDWLNGDTLKLEGFPSKGGEVPKEIFATVCFEASTRQVAQMAAVIGKKDEAEQYTALADKIRTQFQKKYIAADGAMPGDTQAGYAFALNHNLAPDALRAAMVKRLLAGIERYGGHFSTGFHSTVPMMDELVRSGNTDLAYKLISSSEFPGWGFMIEQGATSMWERWDGYVKGRSASRGGEFQDPGMNSFNHFAFGAIGEWMFRVIGGIELDPETPGWRHFLVRPRMGGGLTWSQASFRSINGPIAVSWKLEGDRFIMSLTVPPNSWATVDVPAADAASVTEGGKPVASAEGVAVGGMTDGALRLSVKAGMYEFAAKVK